FIGESGAGKSTVAQALGAACDELTVVRPHPRGALLHATPYWLGRPLESEARALVCLGRATRGPSGSRLRGAPAGRAILEHVVRYVCVAATDEVVLSLAADLAMRVDVLSAICPTGSRFLPFLFQGMAQNGAPMV